MKEESNLGIWELLPHHGRNQEEMIVMNPDDISTLPVLDNLVRKSLVDFHVVDPRVIFVGLALGIIRNLIMKNGPKNLLAVMSVVSIEICIFAKHRQTIVFGCQPVLDILLLLCILESVRRHAQCPHPDFIIQLIVSDRRLNCVAKSPVALVCRDNGPVSMSKNTIMAVTSPREGLTNTCSAKSSCLLHSLIVLQYVCGRRRASS
jgi:hypothetical protein